ncbi:putative 3-methyladenine DNA glycosylase [mine drainage metagenome]|uniref:Putative 3-methyladenine DNA glycosylase n=1 Tax=mine drainage metagenome TaxID=410659 RepID=A0A1J5T816_9ZZZZ
MQKNINKNWNKLLPQFYLRTNVVTIAKDLLGKVLATRFDGILTAGRIVETEAYNGAIDKASHAFGNRRTNRTEIMFATGGCAYVYLCYGVHHLFNVVTNAENIPHAVLIRAVEPIIGIETMLLRANKIKFDHSLTKGPGNVSKALGISTKLTGMSLLSDELFIADDDYKINKNNIIATTRIGVDYSGEDALLPYRFIVKNNPFVSGKKTK